MSRFRKATGLFNIASAMAAVTLFSATGLSAGTVVTAAARQSGTISLQSGALQVGSATVNWVDVMAVFNDARAGGVLPPEVLHLRNGECLAGEILKLGSGQAKISTTFYGERELASDAVKAVDFKSHLPPVQAEEGGMLYRMKGKPVPGSLLWIDGDKVALETPLGVLALTRKELKRAIYDDTETTNAVTGDWDEIALVDGTVLIGHITPAKDGFALKHSLMGEQIVKPDAWRWVRRHPAQVEYLADAQPVSVLGTPLVRQAPPAPRVESSRGLEEGSVFARRMYVWPKTVMEYKLPGKQGGKAQVSAILAPTAGSKGSSVVRFKVGELVLLERLMAAESPAPVAVSFEAEAGSLLALDVDFDKKVRFPCSVTIDDAFVVLR